MRQASQPLVTVGIPTYERPEGLRATLSSITGQSYQNLRITISDNHSSNTEVGRIAKEFEVTDPRVTYHRQPHNIGAIQNFLFLAEEAEGDYFMWAADDDWWDPDFIAEAVALLQSDPKASIALPRFEPLPDPNGKIRRVPPSFQMICRFENLDLVERLDTYIRQKEAFGKAHLIYGLFPLATIKRSLSTLRDVTKPVTPVQDFYHMDIFLNAILLSEGGLVTSQRLLRRYNHAKRGGGTSIKRVLRGVDPHFMNYFSCMSALIDHIDLEKPQKQKLERALKARKFRYYLERVGRKLIIYRIYWSIYKRLHFRRYT